MKTSEKVDKIMPALLRVKAKMEAVKKDSKNPFFKSKYAGLNNYLEGIEPLLQENGLVLMQPINKDSVETIIIHSESGQYVSSEISTPSEISDPQRHGSLITYFRRYSLAGLLAFQTEEDNDGEGFVRPDNKYVKSTTVTPETPKTTTPASFKREFKPKTAETTSGGNEWT